MALPTVDDMAVETEKLTDKCPRCAPWGGKGVHTDGAGKSVPCSYCGNARVKVIDYKVAKAIPLDPDEIK